MKDSDAYVILDELATTRQALTKIMRQLERVEANGKHAEALVSATRAELAETRAIIRNAEANAKGQPSPIARLVQTVAYRAPQPTKQTFDKESRDRAGPRVFVNNQEILGGKITHTVRAKDITGTLIELPTTYDKAHQFMSMLTPNRRLHWRGERATYGAMLALCLRIGFIERKGRGYTWAGRFDVWARQGWLSQFRPPQRVR